MFFLGKRHRKWTQIAENVCYKTKESNLTKFVVKKSSEIDYFKVEHVSGTYRACWACPPGESLGVLGSGAIIRTNKFQTQQDHSSILAPATSSGDSYDVPGGVTNELVIKTKHPVYVEAGETLLLWHTEVLNSRNGDNIDDEDEGVCVNLYGWGKISIMICY